MMTSDLAISFGVDSAARKRAMDTLRDALLAANVPPDVGTFALLYFAAHMLITGNAAPDFSAALFRIVYEAAAVEHERLTPPTIPPGAVQA